MPESVRDRPTRAHEYLFLFCISRRYYYDADGVREPCASGPSDVRKMTEGLPRIGGKHKYLEDPFAGASAATNIGRHRSVGDPSGRNRRSIWTVATEPYRGAHFASFPASLVEPCVLAGTSEHGCCRQCGAPWVRTRTVASWRPGCECEVAEVVPSVVVDPSAGSGTTLAVATRLGRNAVGIELNPDYIELIKGRLLNPTQDGASMTPARETKEAA
jgi:DNA methylase